MIILSGDWISTHAIYEEAYSMTPPSTHMPYIFWDICEDVPFVHAVERLLNMHLQIELLKP